MTGARAVPHKESGQASLLMIAMAVIALALVLVVATAGSIHLDRKRLLSFADSLALEVAGVVASAEIYDSVRASESSGLSPADLTRVMTGERVRSPEHEDEVFSHLEVGELTGSPEAGVMRVHLRAVSQPGTVPWALVPWSDGVAIEVVTSARMAN